jgi:AcrR family transcriptional regulator
MPAPRGEAARQKIIEATQEVLLDNGLDGFTVEAVASRSGSARTTIYRHWPEPKDLVIDTLESLAGQFPVPDTGSLRGDLQAAATIVRPVLEDPRTRRLLLDVTRAAAEDTDIEKIRQRAIRERRQPVQVLLQRAIARGEIDPAIDLNMAMHLVEGPLLSATVLQNRPITDEMLTELVHRIVRALSAA